MLSIKKHVLKLGISMLASDKSFEQNQKVSKKSKSSKISQFLAYSDMFGVKKHVLKLGNSNIW